MSGEADVLYPARDAAFQMAEELAAHILENSNNYHALAGQAEYPGRDRLRFAVLLVMFEEMGKLMALVQQCEKAAKADYLNVRVEDFHNHCLNGRKATAQIMEELRTAEMASLTLGRKDITLSEEPAFVNEDFCSLQQRLLYMGGETQERTQDFIPPGALMDRYATIIERNTLAAGEYIHDLGKALGLWLQLGLKPKIREGEPHSLRYS
jgi:hypothetical protein